MVKMQGSAYRCTVYIFGEYVILVCSGYGQDGSLVQHWQSTLSFAR